MNKAIFIDKDGTLIDDIPYNVDPALIRLASGAVEGLQRLRREGYLIILITNQSGIAHGYFDEKALREVETTLQELLSAHELSLDGFFYCPHHPGGVVAPYDIPCACRKPQPGLIHRAAAEFNVNPCRSWMIGDILNDVEAGNTAGCRTILIDNGNETEWDLSGNRAPTATARDLREAADIILHQSVSV